MTIIARRASGGLGFDASQRVTREQLEVLRTVYSWCADYVPLPGFSAAQIAESCMAKADLESRVSLGFEVLLIQHVRYPGTGGWLPEAHDPVNDAATACEYAASIGYPRGAHLYCDWEGVSVSTDAQTAMMWLQGWAARVMFAGYQAAGLYFGYDSILSPLQFYDLHGFNQYWSDASHRSVAMRGCSIEQGREEIVAGVRIDVDTMAPDRLGDLPFVAAQGDEVA